MELITDARGVVMNTEEAEYWKRRADSLAGALASAGDEITSLQEHLEDCRAFNNTAPKVLSALARLLDVYEYCQESGEDLGNAVLESVQNLISDKKNLQGDVYRCSKQNKII